MCRKCGRAGRPGRYALHLLWLRSLLRGGLPLPAGALPLSTWSDLGALDETMETLRPRLF